MRVPLLRMCGPQVVRDILGYCRFDTACPGDYIYCREEVARELFLVISGTVSVVDNRHISLGTISKGGFFGEPALLSAFTDARVRCTRQVSIRSLGYTELLVLHKSDLRRILADFPVITDKMACILRPHIGANLLRRQELPNRSRALLPLEHVRLWVRVEAIREAMLQLVEKGALG